MSKIILELQYGTLIIKKLDSTWIQKQTMSPGYMLCYEDDIYERGIIYRSKNKGILITKQEELMCGLSKGQKVLKL